MTTSSPVPGLATSNSWNSPWTARRIAILFPTGAAAITPAWSPDGSSIVYANPEGLRLWNVAQGNGRFLVKPSALPLDEQAVTAASFTPDGQRVIFASNAAVWVVPVAGGTPTRILEGLDRLSSPVLSPDGQWLAYRVRENDRYLLVKTRLGDAKQSRIKIAEVVSGLPPVWSPDGRYLATQDKDGLSLFAPDGESKRVLKPQAANAAVWSADSRTLFAVSPGYILSAIDITTGAERRIAEHQRIMIAARRLLPPTARPYLLTARAS